MRLVMLGLVAALTTSAIACSSSDKKDSPANVEKEQQASVEVSAADGGEIKLGKASLEIPGGALSDDTTITVESQAPSSSLPDSASLKGLVYDFGPDGTAFAAPAALTLPSVGSPGEGKEAVIAWLDEDAGAWQDLPTTAAKDGSLVAEISHFTKFVVRLRGVVTDDCSFTKCGGDLVGTWKITGICADVPDSASPLGDQCPTATVDADLSIDGSITFADDGTFTKTFTTSNKLNITLPNACLKAIGQGMLPSACADLNSDAEEEAEDGKTRRCSGTPATECVCTEDGAEETNDTPGTYETTAAGGLTINEEGEDPQEQSYCVTGNELRAQVVDEDGIVITYIGTRQ